MTLAEKQAAMRKVKNLGNKLEMRDRFLFHRGDFIPSPFTASELREIAHTIEAVHFDLPQPLQSHIKNLIVIKLRLMAEQLTNG